MDGSKKALELIWGARAIGEAPGLKERQAFHLLQTGKIPARKVGDSWVADGGKGYWAHDGLEIGCGVELEKIKFYRIEGGRKTKAQKKRPSEKLMSLPNEAEVIVPLVTVNEFDSTMPIDTGK